MVQQGMVQQGIDFCTTVGTVKAATGGLMAAAEGQDDDARERQPACARVAGDREEAAGGSVFSWPAYAYLPDVRLIKRRKYGSGGSSLIIQLQAPLSFPA